MTFIHSHKIEEENASTGDQLVNAFICSLKNDWPGHDVLNEVLPALYAKQNIIHWTDGVPRYSYPNPDQPPTLIKLQACIRMVHNIPFK